MFRVCSSILQLMEDNILQLEGKDFNKESINLEKLFKTLYQYFKDNFFQKTENYFDDEVKKLSDVIWRVICFISVNTILFFFF